MANILTHLVDEQNRHYGASRTALAFADDNEAISSLTWDELAVRTNRAAVALAALSLKETDTVALFSNNRPEMLVTDFAAYANRAIPVAIYATSTPEQVSYILRDSRARILFTDTREHLDKALRIAAECPDLTQIITYKSFYDLPADTPVPVMSFKDFLHLGRSQQKKWQPEVERRKQAASPSDIATLIYTSGTTGEPKGAILTHSNFDSALEEHRIRLTSLSDADTSLSFLPLSHIFEKAWTYFCLWRSMVVTVNYNPHNIQSVIRKVHPTCMCSVPRFWEKVYTAVLEQIGAMRGIKALLTRRALQVGFRRNLHYKRLGLKAPWLLEQRYRFYNRHVFSILRAAIGLRKANIFPTAGAPLSPKIVEFFQSCGINVMIGYGLSETTATVTCFPSVGFEIGSVGTPMSNVQVRIGELSEIQVKGPTIMRGYLNKPEASAEAFTPDGWFRTGDAGRIDEHGALFITERLKDLFKTSNGKYIAPQALESRLGEDSFIEQVAVIGDERKYVTALIVPAFAALEKYARDNGIPFTSSEELLSNPEINRMIADRLEPLQHGLAPFEHIKKFTLLPHPFTIDNGELTNTLKIRRPVIYRHYADRIEQMYS